MQSKKLTLALTLIIALLATSCVAPKKTITESKTEVQTEQRWQQEEIHHLEEFANTIINRILDERLERKREISTTTGETCERVIEEFDTSQPTDSITGTPPLLSRTRETRVTNNQSVSQEQMLESSSDSTTADITQTGDLTGKVTDNGSNQGQQANKAKSHEEKKESTVMTISIIAAIIIIGPFIVLILCTLIKRIKQFLNTH